MKKIRSMCVTVVFFFALNKVKGVFVAKQRQTKLNLFSINYKMTFFIIIFKI